jgi:hypothetical protein
MKYEFRTSHIGKYKNCFVGARARDSLCQIILNLTRVSTLLTFQSPENNPLQRFLNTVTTVSLGISSTMRAIAPETYDLGPCSVVRLLQNIDSSSCGMAFSGVSRLVF